MLTCRVPRSPAGQGGTSSDFLKTLAWARGPPAATSTPRQVSGLQGRRSAARGAFRGREGKSFPRRSVACPPRVIDRRAIGPADITVDTARRGRSGRDRATVVKVSDTSVRVIPAIFESVHQNRAETGADSRNPGDCPLSTGKPDAGRGPNEKHEHAAFSESSDQGEISE